MCKADRNITFSLFDASFFFLNKYLKVNSFDNTVMKDTKKKKKQYFALCYWYAYLE